MVRKPVFRGKNIENIDKFTENKHKVVDVLSRFLKNEVLDKDTSESELQAGTDNYMRKLEYKSTSKQRECKAMDMYSTPGFTCVNGDVATLIVLINKVTILPAVSVGKHWEVYRNYPEDPGQELGSSTDADADGGPDSDSETDASFAPGPVNDYAADTDGEFYDPYQ